MAKKKRDLRLPPVQGVSKEQHKNLTPAQQQAELAAYRQAVREVNGNNLPDSWYPKPTTKKQLKKTIQDCGRGMINSLIAAGEGKSPLAKAKLTELLVDELLSMTAAAARNFILPQIAAIEVYPDPLFEAMANALQNELEKELNETEAVAQPSLHKR
jgi:hypothetical protein